MTTAAVETLRKAAALMRSRAEAHTDPEAWLVTRSHRVVSAPRAGFANTVADIYPTGGSRRQQANAEHIASWHPAVALDAAALLDATADGIEARGVTARIKPAETAALTLANRYLGADA